MGLINTIVAIMAMHPEMIKDFVMFFLAWILLKHGVEKNFSKIVDSIEKLTATMASLEKNHSERLHNLEIKVDKLTQPKGE